MYKFVAPFTIVLIIGAFFYSVNVHDKLPYILIKNVGQGESIWIVEKTSKMLVIDGGPDYEITQRIRKFFGKQACEVSGIVLTHPHADHVTGLTRILQYCTPLFVFFNDVAYDSAIFESFKELAVPKGIELYQGDSLKFGNFTLFVLWPPKNMVMGEGFSDINNSSIVILLDYGTFEALLTGDIDARVQNELNLDNYSHIIDGEIELYKVPHHGSPGSFNLGFLASLRPETAVISVGENTYGHPSVLFLDYFRKHGIKLFRTDFHGDIKITLYENPITT